MSMQAINFAMTLPVDDPGPRLLLFIIAHHINWKTGTMHVGQKELADEARVSERSVRRFVVALEEAGFIARRKIRDDKGHQGVDEITLIGYLEWQDVLYNGGTIPAPASRGKPVQTPADNLAGGAIPGGQTEQSQADKFDVQADTAGRHIEDKPSLTISGTLARGRAGEPKSSPATGALRPAITIRRNDASWGAWLDRIEAAGGLDMRDAAAQQATLIVETRWPTASSNLPAIPGFSRRGKMAAAGEAA